MLGIKKDIKTVNFDIRKRKIAQKHVCSCIYVRLTICSSYLCCWNEKGEKEEVRKILSTTFDCQFKTAFQVILIFNIPSAVVNSGAENEKAKKMK